MPRFRHTAEVRQIFPTLVDVNSKAVELDPGEIVELSDDVAAELNTPWLVLEGDARSSKDAVVSEPVAAPAEEVPQQ